MPVRGTSWGDPNWIYGEPKYLWEYDNNNDKVINITDMVFQSKLERFPRNMQTIKLKMSGFGQKLYGMNFYYIKNMKAYAFSGQSVHLRTKYNINDQPYCIIDSDNSNC